METKNKKTEQTADRAQEKHLKILPPLDPDECIVPEDDPDIIPDEDPFENPPLDEPVAGEGP
jgi:hypothetical protein